MKLIHVLMSDVGGVMYDKDMVYVNVHGSFTWQMGEDGDKAGVSFSCCRGLILSVTLSVPQGEGECMVMDLQDVTLSLANGIFKSNI